MNEHAYHWHKETKQIRNSSNQAILAIIPIGLSGNSFVDAAGELLATVLNEQPGRAAQITKKFLTIVNGKK